MKFSMKTFTYWNNNEDGDKSCMMKLSSEYMTNYTRLSSTGWVAGIVY